MKFVGLTWEKCATNLWHISSSNFCKGYVKLWWQVFFELFVKVSNRKGATLIYWFP